MAFAWVLATAAGLAILHLLGIMGFVLALPSRGQGLSGPFLKASLLAYSTGIASALVTLPFAMLLLFLSGRYAMRFPFGGALLAIGMLLIPTPFLIGTPTPEAWFAFRLAVPALIVSVLVLALLLKRFRQER